MSAIRMFRPEDPAEQEPEHPITVNEVVAHFLANQSGRYSTDALAYRKRYLKRFCEDYGQKSVSSCIPFDLENWLNQHSEWASAWTQKTVCSAIQRPFNWAVKMRLIGENPFAGITREEGEPRRAMTREEMQALLRNTSPLFRRVLIFLWSTGCRPGEMSKAEWTMVNWELGIISLDKHKTKKHTRKPRVIVLTALAVRLLRWLEKRLPFDGYVFSNNRGNPWDKNSLSLRMQRIRERAGVAEDCKLYGTRHAWATNSVLAGCSPKLAATAMGTSLATFEKHYVHVSNELEAQRAVAEKASKRRE